MRVVLTYFDQRMGPSVFYTIPNEISVNEKRALEQAMDLSTNNEFFELENESVNSANYLFEIKSDWSRGKVETLMISVLAERNLQDLSRFEPLFEKIAAKFQNTKNIFKGFHQKSENQDIIDIGNKLKKIQVLISEFYRESQIQINHMKIGNIFILGLDGAGKTELVEHIKKTENVSIKTKERISKSIIRIVFQNADLDIYDLGGLKNIQDIWKENPDAPEAILFVIDHQAGKEEHQKSLTQFEDAMNFFFGDNPTIELPEKTPVLILGTNTESPAKIKVNYLYNLLRPERWNINYKIGYSSLEKNYGVYENLSWIISELVRYL